MNKLKKNGKGYKLLLKSISELLIPKFIDDGFVLSPLGEEDLRSELRYRQPFGSLRRKCDDGVQVVEIVFRQHPHKNPKFTLDFVVIPKGGITLPWGQHLEVGDAHVSAMPVFYELCSNSLYAPFGFGFFSSVSEKNADKIVNDALIKSNYIDKYFANYEIGKYVRKVTYS